MRGAVCGLFVALGGVTGLPAMAEVGLSARQLALIDGQLADRYGSTAPEIARQPRAADLFQATPRYDGRYTGQFRRIATQAARRHGIPVGLFLKLVETESAWRPRARSHAGAMGLAQLMPGTARYLGVTDPWDPVQNLNGGARYLAEQYREFRDWRLALAAYNAGPQAVRRYGGIPPFRETQNYVRLIMGR